MGFEKLDLAGRNGSGRGYNRGSMDCIKGVGAGVIVTFLNLWHGKSGRVKAKWNAFGMVIHN